MTGKVQYIMLHETLSRHERREMEALGRAKQWAFIPKMPARDRERLRTWFREWREHLWRCYEAQ